MSTQAETLLAAVQTILTAGSIGATVERSRSAALDRSALPMAIVKPKESTPEHISTFVSKHALQIEIAIHVRGDVPDQVADPIVCQVHLALMADATLGGKCARLLGPAMSWEEADADGDAGVITMTYTMHYLTDSRDLGRQA